MQDSNDPRREIETFLDTIEKKVPASALDLWEAFADVRDLAGATLPDHTLRVWQRLAEDVHAYLDATPGWEEMPWCKEIVTLLTEELERRRAA